MGEATLKLFFCVPYKVRLLPSACARRHEIARTTGRTTAAHVGVRLCFGCDVGAAHEAGEAGADLFDVKARVSGIEPEGKRLRAPARAPAESHRTCPCGTRFKLTNRSMVYCDIKCDARPKPKGPKVPKGPRIMVCRGCKKISTVEGRVNGGRRYCQSCRP